MIRYVVTVYRGSSGANLSRPGYWGNLPFTSAIAAREAARIDAAGSPYTVTQETSRRSREEV